MRIKSVRPAWNFWVLRLAASLAVFSWVPLANAALLNNIDGVGESGGGALIVGTVRWGISFQVDETQTGIFEFTIRVDNTFDLSPATVNLQIWNDDGSNNPDDVTTPSQPFSLTRVGGPGPNSGTLLSGLYTFTGTGTLTAGDGDSFNYWLVATPNTGETYGWLDSGAYTSGGATFEGTKNNDGTGWPVLEPGNTLSLTVTAVPEPAHTGVIAAIFLAACSLTHFIRRRRAASLAPARS